MPIIVLKLGKGSGVIGDPTQRVGGLLLPQLGVVTLGARAGSPSASLLSVLQVCGLVQCHLGPRSALCVRACVCVCVCVFASVYGLFHTFRCPAPQPSPPVDSVVTSLWLLVSMGAAGPGCVPMWSAWRRLLPTCS